MKMGTIRQTLLEARAKEPAPRSPEEAKQLIDVGLILLADVVGRAESAAKAAMKELGVAYVLAEQVAGRPTARVLFKDMGVPTIFLWQAVVSVRTDLKVHDAGDHDSPLCFLDARLCVLGWDEARWSQCITRLANDALRYAASIFPEAELLAAIDAQKAKTQGEAKQ